MPPNSPKCPSNRLICDLNSTPAANQQPTQRTAEQVLRRINRCRPMRMAPAKGGAMIAKPGTNLAMTNEFTPQRSKRVCVSLTHLSGSGENLHSVFITWMPYLSPTRYQPQSAATQAITEQSSSDAREI